VMTVSDIAPASAAASRRDRPAAQLFPDRPRAGRSDLHHHQSDVVVRELGGRPDAARSSRSAFAPETYLPFKVPGLWRDHRAVLADAARISHRQTLVGRFAGRIQREPASAACRSCGPIYKTMKQIFETLFLEIRLGLRQGLRSLNFRTGMWSVVVPGVAADRGHRDAFCPARTFVSCFLPCTPNPTTGFFFYAPAQPRSSSLDITVEQAMTLIMSAGMAQPNGDAQKKLTALVENGRARATPSPPGRACAVAVDDRLGRIVAVPPADVGWPWF